MRTPHRPRSTGRPFRARSPVAVERREARRLLTAVELLPTLAELRSDASQVVDAPVLPFDSRIIAQRSDVNVESEVVLYPSVPRWDFSDEVAVAAIGGLPRGTYYIDVYGYGGTFNPAYTLTSSVWVADTPAPIAADRFEPNNTRNRATDLGQIVATSEVSGRRVGSSSSIGDVERIPLAGLPAGSDLLRMFGYRGASNPDYSIRFNHGTVVDPPLSLPFTGGSVTPQPTPPLPSPRSLPRRSSST